MDYQAFLTDQQLDSEYLVTALKWFKPLGDEIAVHHNGASNPFYVGINGAQGSGKSTLAAFLDFYLSQVKGLNVVRLSLDDFYLSQSDRLALSVKIHPLLKTRGVPGTHNMPLMNKTLERLKEYGTVSIPRFNKATDNPYPVLEWPIVNSPVDIVIFEGWCWGTRAQANAQLNTPINTLEAEEDALGVWRNYINEQLAEAYEPIYALMDYWVMLRAPSFNCVEGWRIEQEHKLAARTAGVEQSAIMTDQQVKAFVSYFQRLTEHTLATLPEHMNCVYQLNEQRQITSTQAEFL
ncbi:kinase [Alteromonas sp. ASW11-36]|uniref:Kinase n=1 Tax=Alteromonas arenosi TaxID=3055817 RepID=A0ABT7SY74_9ALTE|nr:kinase [Alteromonas sp. ASW11-36]MDM7860959.1 kinase [Alteromonas sp. ASW11-36]